MQVNVIPSQVKSALNQFSQQVRQGNSFNEAANTYHNLIYTMTEGILQSCYPHFFIALDSQIKESLLRKFLRNHPCTHPTHHQIPTEFINFLQTENLPEILNKVAEIEWLELSLELCHKPATINMPWNNDFFNYQLAVSPFCSLICLSFDFDQITSEYMPLLENTVYYRLIYNDNNEVKNMALTKFMARLIQLFQTYSSQQVNQLISIFIRESQEKINERNLKAAIMWLYQQNILLLA